MGVAVGIDLGTTNSCVAIVQGDQAKIVESVYGDRIHPSVICFHPSGDVLAGPRAKERMAIDPENTIYSFKRLLGQNISAPEIQKLISHLPYNVIERNGIPVLQTRNKEATLPEVSALMLKYLREMCEETFGVRIDEAIITVPANFTDVQRASTKIAGRIAGFNVLRILNEPTAAALAYGFGGDKEERIAVYDFGGGTFDITIIELLDDIFEVLSTAGDNFLGGDDFDDKIVFDMLKQFEKTHGFTIEDNPVAMQRVRSVAERAKCQLSSITEVNATLRELVTDKHGRKIDFSFTITRERFETLASSLVERSLATCEEALELAKLKPENLDNVVLVGGSTRIPLVRRQVEEFFGRKPKTQINPDEVVAIGAAINAFSLTQEALDPAIRPKKRANVRVDPFAAQPSAKTKPSARTEDADPFSSTKSPLADMTDPFADKKDPFASKKGPVSSRPPRTLGRIELSQKRTMIGMGGANGPLNVGRDVKSDNRMPTETSLSGASLQTEDNSVDLPGLPATGHRDEDMSIPPPRHQFDSELDSWGEPDLDGPIPGQSRPSRADDPDLPVPVDRPSMPAAASLGLPAEDADLPIPMGPVADGLDLPTTAGKADLPTTAGKTDLPTTAGKTDLPTTTGMMDLPVAVGERDLPIPMGLSSAQTGFDTEIGCYEDDAFGALVIESDSPMTRPDGTSPFGAGPHTRALNSTDEIDTLDDMDVEELGDDEAFIASPPSFHPAPAAGQSFIERQPGFAGRHDDTMDAERPQTSPQRAFGHSEPESPSFARQSIPPAFDPELGDGLDAPRMPSYHPYHPLDEVVGDDGREARSETHEAFTVPIKNATPAVLLDVSPRGLGIATAGGYCDIIIERNAAIPIEQSRHFSTSRDFQTEVYIDVYQGESRRTEDNTQLGRIEMRNLRPAPRGEISIMVTFEVDTDGILNVHALNEETNASQSTQIKLTGGLADDQVEALVEKYAKHAK
ncbi:MAG: Hsp70 family protein [Deltaproteobacteria bacterium]|nr:Hsp70 family protein [Deltaproteobacteria bacterium]